MRRWFLRLTALPVAATAALPVLRTPLATNDSLAHPFPTRTAATPLSDTAGDTGAVSRDMTANSTQYDGTPPDPTNTSNETEPEASSAVGSSDSATDTNDEAAGTEIAPQPPAVDIGQIILVDAAPGPQPDPELEPVSCDNFEVDPAIYDGVVAGYGGALTNAIELACGGDWSGSVNEVAHWLQTWALEWSKVTADAQVDCSATLTPAGSAATGCAWSVASAYAGSYALAGEHAAAAAAAFTQSCVSHCRNPTVGGWSFSRSEETLLLVTNAYAVASHEACATGNQSAATTEWTVCYALSLADTIAMALVTSLLDQQCFDRAVELEVEKTIASQTRPRASCTAIPQM